MPIDQETLKIPAFMRKRSLNAKLKKKLILTALDRKNAGLSPTRSTVKKLSKNPRNISYTQKRIAQTAFAKPKPKILIRHKTSPATFLPPILKNKQPKKTKRQKEKIIGTVTHYYDKIQVAVIKLQSPLKLGDKLRIQSSNGDFEQTIKSMQINRKDVKRAGKGKEIGIKTTNVPSVKEKVFLIKVT